LIVAVIGVFLVVPVLDSVTTQGGVVLGVSDGYPAKESGMPEMSVITELNGNPIRNITEFKSITTTMRPGDNVTLVTDQGTYSFTAVVDHRNESKGYMGVLVYNTKMVAKQGMDIWYAILNWLHDLIFWIYFISLNIGLINLYPIFITDGALMLKVSISKIVKDQKKAFKIWKHINVFAVLVLLILMVVPFLRWLIKILSQYAFVM
jgi:hypothetical protein